MKYIFLISHILQVKWIINGESDFLIDFIQPVPEEEIEQLWEGFTFARLNLISETHLTDFLDELYGLESTSKIYMMLNIPFLTEISMQDGVSDSEI